MILRLHHIPIGMEMFNARNDAPIDAIKKALDESDYCIFIIGFLYGSKLENGKSYTETEYDYAIEKNIPILVFPKDETVPISSNQREIDNSENYNLLKDFREKASKKCMVKWNNETNLSKEVAASLSQSYFKENPAYGWVRDNKKGNSDNEENIKIQEDINGLKTRIDSVVTDINKNSIDFSDIIIQQGKKIKSMGEDTTISITELQKQIMLIVGKSHLDFARTLNLIGIEKYDPVAFHNYIIAMMTFSIYEEHEHFIGSAYRDMARNFPDKVPKFEPTRVEIIGQIAESIDTLLLNTKLSQEIKQWLRSSLDELIRVRDTPPNGEPQPKTEETQ